MIIRRIMMIKRRRGSRKRGKRHRRNKRDDEKDESDLAKPPRNWKRGTVDGESGRLAAWCSRTWDEWVFFIKEALRANPEEEQPFLNPTDLVWFLPECHPGHQRALHQQVFGWLLCPVWHNHALMHFGHIPGAEFCTFFFPRLRVWAFYQLDRGEMISSTSKQEGKWLWSASCLIGSMVLVIC